MSAWNLPATLNVAGKEYEIREDFRAALDVITAFEDESLSESEKVQAAMEIMYFPVLPPEKHIQEAFEQILWFLDCGIQQEDGPKPRTMDWEKDSSIIFPAINKIAGFEVRCNKVIHWWTFYGWFMEISDGLFSQVLAIRQKLAKGKKLEKWEQEFLRNNRNLCDLKGSSDHNQEEYDFFADLLKRGEIDAGRRDCSN